MTRDSSDIRGCEDSGPTIICGSRGQHAFFSAALKLCDNVIQRIWLNILLPFLLFNPFFLAVHLHRDSGIGFSTGFNVHVHT